MLTKTVTILEEWDIGEYRHFNDEGDIDVKYILYIDDEMRRELGFPEKITVTIEPGDKLNDPYATCEACATSTIFHTCT